MSDWSSNEAKEFLSIIRGEAEKVVKDFGDRQSSIYACLAVVTDIDESGDISVRLLSSPSDGSQDFVVPNQSGSVLNLGDSVWIHYWGDYTNAYIGIRNGADSVPINTGLTQTQVVNLVYPVGAIYISVSSTSPAALFGGTWSAWGSGRVPVGVNTNDTDFASVEKVGGTKTVTLDTTQIPSHHHTFTTGSGSYASNGYATRGNYTQGENYTTSNVGGGLAHNNLQPYITCYMFKRIA